jgi:hypothetical protein
MPLENAEKGGAAEDDLHGDDDGVPGGLSPE